MNALSELSGTLARGVPSYTPDCIQKIYPFPGNMAIGLIENPSSATQLGGSESAWRLSDFGWATQPNGDQPHREGVGSESLAYAQVFFQASLKRLETDTAKLKKEYVFRNEDAITHFISIHRTVAAVLSCALPELKKSFGEDAVFSLEAVPEDDDSTSLYAVVIWRGSAQDAESALEDFDERWWLNQPYQSGLTFTYELA